MCDIEGAGGRDESGHLISLCDCIITYGSVSLKQILLGLKKSQTSFESHDFELDRKSRLRLYIFDTFKCQDFEDINHLLVVKTNSS